METFVIECHIFTVETFLYKFYSPSKYIYNHEQVLHKFYVNPSAAGG